MPRAPRALADGLPHHAIARANGGARLFRAARDFEAFLRLLEAALGRRPLALLGYCLMPNHVHLVLAPERGADLSLTMQWLLATFAARHNARRKAAGHVWQGRFRAFPIQDDAHLWTVLRYVERNALRAGLCARAEDWRWSSLARRLGPGAGGPALADAALPPDWAAWVNEPQSAAELDLVRRSVNSGLPFGAPDWVRHFREPSGTG